MTVYHIAGIVVGLALIIACGWQLVKIGYEGGYFDEFLASFTMQLFFVGGVALVVWGVGRFHTAFLIAAGVVSLILPFAGFLAFRIPIWKSHKASKDLRKSVMNGKKYRSFIAFVRKNADRIGAIYDNGTVVWAPGDTPLFVPSDNGYEVSWTWNSALGDMVASRPGQPKTAWEFLSFFPIREGERPWNWEEQRIIAKLVEESLPGDRDRWSRDVDGRGFHLMPPKQTQKRQRRNPY